jgi:hypothetical protein
MFATGPAAGQAPQPQAPTAPQPAAARPEPVRAAPAVRLQVVLSRFNGDKRIANQPYHLVAVGNGRPQVLRIGAEVPIAGAAGTKDNPNYKSVGTNILATVTVQDDGRYLVGIDAESSSPYADDQKQAGRPAFRSYKLNGTAYLRDGQTAELAVATDSLTGEVIRMEVTLTAMK